MQTNKIRKSKCKTRKKNLRDGKRSEVADKADTSG